MKLYLLGYEITRRGRQDSRDYYECTARMADRVEALQITIQATLGAGTPEYEAFIRMIDGTRLGDFRPDLSWAGLEIVPDEMEVRT